MFFKRHSATGNAPITALLRNIISPTATECVVALWFATSTENKRPQNCHCPIGQIATKSKAIFVNEKGTLQGGSLIHLQPVTFMSVGRACRTREKALSETLAEQTLKPTFVATNCLRRTSRSSCAHCLTDSPQIAPVLCVTSCTAKLSVGQNEISKQPHRGGGGDG